MPADAILSIITAVLSAAATYAPPLYRAIVGDGRTLDQVLAEARVAVDAIPAAPAASSIDAAIAARLAPTSAAPWVDPHLSARLTADRLARLQRLTQGAVLSHEEREDVRALLAVMRP